MNAGIGARIPRAARWAMVAVTVAYILPAPLTTSFGVKDYPPSGPAAVAIPLGLAIIALQLRNSFSAIRGERPRGAYLSLLALVVLTYLPLRWFWYGEWLGVQVAVIASASMLLPRWPAVAVFAAAVIGTDVVDVRSLSGQPAGTVLNWVGLDTMAWFLGWLAVYGCVPLVRLVDELRGARTELAELAVGRERLRVSRLSMDVVDSGNDFSQDPKFTEAVAHKVYFGPVYFRKESEPYITMAVVHGGKGGVTVAEVRQALGTTRKYLLPLLGHLDATGVTRRRGDVRVAGPKLPAP